MACFERFDEALLSLFTYEQLARPFRIMEYNEYVWYVYQDNRRASIILSGEMYEAQELPPYPAGDHPADWR